MKRTLKAAGIDYEKSYTYSSSHADYYPGATLMTIKLLFDKKTSVSFLVPRSPVIRELTNAAMYCPQPSDQNEGSGSGGA